MNFHKSQFLLSFWLLVVAAFVSGCSTSPIPHYTGEDGATLVFSMTTSSSIPPVLSLRRVGEQEPVEIVYLNDQDGVLAPAVAGGERVKVGIVRRVQPGEYLLVGAGLGGAEHILRGYKSFETPLPVTLRAHEVTYIGSYNVDLKILPNADQKTTGAVTTVALSGLSLEFSVVDSMRSDLEALAVLKPELDVANVRNATPEIGRKTNN